MKQKWVNEETLAVESLNSLNELPALEAECGGIQSLAQHLSERNAMVLIN